jgi:hypothetical protein
MLVAGDVKRLFSDLQHLIGLMDAKVTRDGPTAQYEAICGPIAGRISYRQPVRQLYFYCSPMWIS